jgi:hypothetical protein
MGPEVLIVVYVNSMVFWDVMPYGLVVLFNQRFEESSASVLMVEEGEQTTWVTWSRMGR